MLLGGDLPRPRQRRGEGDNRHQQSIPKTRYATHVPSRDRRLKEPVCVLWPRSAVTGSCLLPGSSISVRLNLGTTLLGADRSNETSKKHILNKLFNQPKAGAAVRQQDASSPRLEVLRNRGSLLKHSYTRYVQSSFQHLVQSS